ncbi:MAG: cupin domain-containing protein [Daejeonella sp.]
MNTLTTLSEVLNQLKERGYTTDFNVGDNCLICHGNSLELHPDEFVVDRHYRFEGSTDPGDQAIFYAISSLKNDVKGVLVNGYGVYSDPMTDEMVNALRTREDSADTDSEIKFNEATPQRPEGDRPINAELIEIDLIAAKQQIRNEAPWENSDRNAITLFKNENMRIVMIALHDGAEMKTHTASGVISVQVLEGGISFRTEKKSSDINEGQMVTLQAGVPHSVFARSESVFLLTLALKI